VFGRRDEAYKIGRRPHASTVFAAVLTWATLAAGGCAPQPGSSVVQTATPTATPTAVPTARFEPTATTAGVGPGDCGAVEASICESAVSFAMTRGGLDPKLVPAIVRWTVRPTSVLVCSPGLEPRFDVTFEFPNSPSITVTIGRYTYNGKLEVCTH
jgi:hypothetical protein